MPYIFALSYAQIPSLHSRREDANKQFLPRMHFSAKRGIAIACRLSVCLSVTLVNCDHIG